MSGVYELTVKVPFVREGQARIAYNSLRVDKEPKRSSVEKTLSVDGGTLVAPGISVARAPRSVRDVNPYMCQMKPLREGYNGRLLVDPGNTCYRCCCKKDAKDVEAERARLEWELNRRRNFISKCCEGLLATPCCSVGSFSDALNDTQEPAEFFVSCDCSKKKTKKKSPPPPKRKDPRRTVVTKPERHSIRDNEGLGCCCSDRHSSRWPPAHSMPQYYGDMMYPQQFGFEERIPPSPYRPSQTQPVNPQSDLSELVDQLKSLVQELRAQRKYSERGLNNQQFHE